MKESISQGLARIVAAHPVFALVRKQGGEGR
jgi:hypothetical protein